MHRFGFTAKATAFAGLALLRASAAFANGAWGHASEEIWATGQVYVEGEHPDIKLVNELLRISAGTDVLYRVDYEYLNAAAAERKVRCGFPVELRLRLPEEGGPAKGLAAGILAAFLAEDARPAVRKDPDAPAGRAPAADPASAALGRLRSGRTLLGQWDWTKLPPGFPNLDFSISQDGAVVRPVSFVAEAAREDADGLVVRLNVMYDLVFPASRASFVKVAYRSPSFREEFGASYQGERMSYGSSYVLGTGRTWKGPIDALLVVVEYETYPGTLRVPRRLRELSDLRLAGGEPNDRSSIVEGRGYGRQVYYAATYEPAPGDLLELSYGYSTFDLPQGPGPDDEPAPLPPEPAVTRRDVPGSTLTGRLLGPKSGYRKGRATSYETATASYSADFSPERAFDGLRTTAWVPEAGPFVLDFELDRDSSGLALLPGYYPVSRSYLDVHAPYAVDRDLSSLGAAREPAFEEPGPMTAVLRFGDEAIPLELAPRGGGWYSDARRPLPAGRYRLEVDGPVAELEFPPAGAFGAAGDPVLAARAALAGLAPGSVGTELAACYRNFTAKDTLRLRAGPGVADAVLGRASRGEALTALLRTQGAATVDGIKAPWYYVRRGDGTCGWCFGGYLAAVP